MNSINKNSFNRVSIEIHKRGSTVFATYSVALLNRSTIVPRPEPSRYVLAPRLLNGSVLACFSLRSLRTFSRAHTKIHAHAYRRSACTGGSGALKLSLYFIGRAYKSKASASQILEALHTRRYTPSDVQNADTCLSRSRTPDWPARSHKYKHASYTRPGYLSMFIAVRIKACLVCFTDNN